MTHSLSSDPSVDALSKSGAETAPTSRLGSESEQVHAKGRETPAINRTGAPTDVLSSLKKKWKRIARRAKEIRAASTSEIPHPSSSNSVTLLEAVNLASKRGRMVAYTLVALGDDDVGRKTLTNLVRFSARYLADVILLTKDPDHPSGFHFKVRPNARGLE
jgi:hypothetical protein